jgi:hypothetical protein
MGYCLGMSLQGQVLEDSRAVGRLMGSQTYEAIAGRIDEIVRRDGFDGFIDADQGICQVKRIIRIALGADEAPIDHDRPRSTYMSCSTIATIHHAEGVRIDDVDALNRELMDLGNMSFGELYSPRSALLPEWRGPFMIDGNDEILIADAESEGRCEYGSSTQVWACWSRSVTDAIARHLVQGEIVFEIVEEGQPYEYLVITPGSFDVRDDY